MYYSLGKSNPYCELTMGAQCYTSRALSDTLSPRWNFSCQFFVKDLYQDVLCLTVFERDQFSPDGELDGRRAQLGMGRYMILSRIAIIDGRDNYIVL